MAKAGATVAKGGVIKSWVKNTQAPQKGAAVKGAAAKGKGWPAGGKGWPAGGKGWSAGGKAGGKAARPKQESLPKDFEVDSALRYTGVVQQYGKWSGYGFIAVSEKGSLPNDRVFVYWTAITSEDRFPSLRKDMEVEFSVKKAKSREGVWSLSAVRVTAAGGAAISVQDSIDTEKKEFVGGQHVRYTGTLKFYDPTQGFGYINLDDGQEMPEPVPTELRVERAEVNADGRQPQRMKDLQVECGIWKTPKGAFKAYNMTFPGAVPISQSLLENRQSVNSARYTGTIEIWMKKFGWGFIKVGDNVKLPAAVNAKIEEMNKATKEKGKSGGEGKSLYFRRMDLQEGARPDKDDKVTFQIYTDDKGAGACQVTLVGK